MKAVAQLKMSKGSYMPTACLVLQTCLFVLQTCLWLNKGELRTDTSISGLELFLLLSSLPVASSTLGWQVLPAYSKFAQLASRGTSSSLSGSDPDFDRILV